MSTHHRGNRDAWEEEQEARVRLMVELVAAGRSPTTGDPVATEDDADFLDGLRRSKAQRRA